MVLLVEWSATNDGRGRRSYGLRHGLIQAVAWAWLLHLFHAAFSAILAYYVHFNSNKH